MVPTAAEDNRPVLVVGATGDLGGRALRALLARGKKARALVRPGSDTSGLPKSGVEAVRGDMLDPPSLGPAMTGVSAVVARRSDTLDVERPIPSGPIWKEIRTLSRRPRGPAFLGSSSSAFSPVDQAPDVPHFRAKKLTEDRLQEQGVPFVAVRPGAFLGGRWMKAGLEHGQVMGLTRRECGSCTSFRTRWRGFSPWRSMNPELWVGGSTWARSLLSRGPSSPRCSVASWAVHWTSLL